MGEDVTCSLCPVHGVRHDPSSLHTSFLSLCYWVGVLGGSGGLPRGTTYFPKRGTIDYKIDICKALEETLIITKNTIFSSSVVNTRGWKMEKKKSQIIRFFLHYYEPKDSVLLTPSLK